jgi:hypothetical protein
VRFDMFAALATFSSHRGCSPYPGVPAIVIIASRTLILALFDHIWTLHVGILLFMERDYENELDTFDTLCLAALRVLDRLTNHRDCEHREGKKDCANARGAEENEKHDSQQINSELHVISPG